MKRFLREFGIHVKSHRLRTERRLSKYAHVCTNPIFVFGNQKSGTTAIAGLLAHSTDTPAVLDFQGAHGDDGLRLIRGEMSVAEFVWRNAWAFSHKIIKEPTLTFASGAIMDHFGVSQAVFIVRDPRENIRSMLQRLRIAGDLVDLPRAELRRQNPAWQAILTGADLGFSPDHYVTILARRWLRAMEIYEQLRERLILVRYEEFERDKIRSIRDLAHTLGLHMSHDISHLVDHAFQPRAKKPADIRSFFGPKNLERIDSICSPKAGTYGYLQDQAVQAAGL